MNRLRMLFLLFSLPLLNRCVLFSEGLPSHVGETPEALKSKQEHVPLLYDLHPYAGGRDVVIGSWVTYQIEDRTVTLSTISRRGESVWWEIKEHGAPPRVSARLVDDSGEVRKAFYRSSPDGTVFPQKLTPAPLPSPSSFELVDQTTAQENFPLGGKVLSATVIRSQYEDEDGLRKETEEWRSAEVPSLFDSSPQGGLLQRDKIRLLEFGDGAQPSFDLPN